jgi:hypothetical protein
LCALIVAMLLVGGGRRVAAQVLPPVGPLTVSTATAGSEPNAATGSVTYSSGLLFVGQRKLQANLNANMPANTTLAVRVTGGVGGTSLGYINLDTTPRDVVVAASQTFFVSNTVAYIFTALVTAGVIPVSSRTVTFTIATWP